ncbi:hypothetical protein AAF712_011020 [Marasmius tenuissimus]|uniref:Uncharacterized protein n=1 Tax=Marasmius tenuissimus TaxID=585030 RepID=A0ABR2ZL39_9AGAR
MPTHPFLPLVPQWNVFTDELLSCLDYSEGHFPMFRDHKRKWRLASQIAKDWDLLEIGLRRLVRGLIEAADPGEVLLSEQFSMWTYPAHYGYKRPHNSSESLQRAAAASRDAFLPLLATGTLALTCLERRKRIDPGFVWREKMIKKSHSHPEWLSSFERAYSVGKKVRRVGGILDASRPETRPRIRGLVSLYSALNVGIVIYWGSHVNFPNTYLRSILLDERSLDPISVDRSWKIQQEEALGFAMLVPSNDELNILRQTRGYSPACDGNVDGVPPQEQLVYRDLSGRHEDTASGSSTLEAMTNRSLDDDDDDDDDLLEPNSGQLPGETWQQFFTRRDERRTGRKESPLQRQTRVNREKEAVAKRCPGKKGPSIWYWRQRGPHRVRTLLTRRQHEDHWNFYGRDQKRFDGWSNCWDICSEFGEFDSENDDDFDDTPAIVPLTDENPTPDNAPALVAFSADVPKSNDNPPSKPAPPKDRDLVEDGELEEETLSIELNDSSGALGVLVSAKDYGITYRVEDLGMAVETVAYERYGFTGEPVDLGPADERMDWVSTLRLLGNERWTDNVNNDIFKEEPPAEDMQVQLRRHIYLLSRSKADSFQTIPSLDLTNYHNFIHKNDAWEFSVRKVEVD